MNPNERIARLRRLADVTQFRLASLTGINTAFLSMYETGQRPLTAEQVALLERVLYQEVEAKAQEARRLVRQFQS